MRRGFGSAAFSEDFDRGNPDRSRHFQGFGAGHKLAAVGRRQEVDLDLDGDPDPPRRQSRSDRDPGRLIGQRGDDPTMKMTEELYQVGPARQRDLGAAGFDRDDAEARGAGKTLGVDGLGKARRIKGGVAHAGMRTGSDSMPRTKLE